MKTDNPLEKWGFEYKEGVEIFKQIDNQFFGIMKTSEGKTIPCYWNKLGVPMETDGCPIGENYLTQIKKKWYEDESNFPCAVVYNEGMSGNKDKIIIMRCYKKEEYVLCSQEGGIYHDINNCRLATKEEALSLVVEEQYWREANRELTNRKGREKDKKEKDGA